MKCSDILARLEDILPCEKALSWDNVGLLAGRGDKEVKRILLGLDLTNGMLKKAVEKKADLIITHHPLIFSGIKSINDETVLGRKLLKLIHNDISYIAMHTNYDVCKNCMADISASCLGLQNTEVLSETSEQNGEVVGVGKIGELKQKMSLIGISNLVKERFDTEALIVYGNLDDKFDRLAISPGSGKGMYKEALKKDVHLLITGDITHHEGIDAYEAGVSIIDAGHYAVEKIFIKDMKEKLETFCDGFEIFTYYEELRRFI